MKPTAIELPLSLVFIWMASCACSPGPGADPLVLPDASVRPEAAIADAAPDAEARDASPTDVPVAVWDAGALPWFPFTGVYGILNSTDALYAREVDGHLSLLVAGFPYVYDGTIDLAGNVEVVSDVLLRAGCPAARIRGRYGRTDALFQLEHQTCNAANEPVVGPLNGGFGRDFFAGFSGIFDVQMVVVNNWLGCYDGPLQATGVWAVDVVDGGRARLYAVEDIVSGGAQYLGKVSEQGGFEALQAVSARPGAPQVALSGIFRQVTTQDPLLFSGQRFVYQHERSCSFEVSFTSQRMRTL